MRKNYAMVRLTIKSFYLSKKNIDGSHGAPNSSLIYTFSLANMATRIKRKRRCVDCN